MRAPLEIPLVLFVLRRGSRVKALFPIPEAFLTREKTRPRLFEADAECLVENEDDVVAVSTALSWKTACSWKQKKQKKAPLRKGLTSLVNVSRHPEYSGGDGG